jgi:ABC-type sugar transport system substrate-binding protein
MRAADNYLRKWDTLATHLPSLFTPLPAKPAPGGVVTHLTGPLPSEQLNARATAAAAATVGWTAKNIQFNGSVEDLNIKMEQAISDGAKIITEAGFPIAAIAKPIADAKAHGAVVVASDISDTPYEFPGYAGVNASNPTYKVVGEMNAYKFMQDSHCSGSVAIFDLPYPILKVDSDSFTATVKAHCPACKISYTLIQTSDVGTPAATNAIVSKLQSSPSTKYVFFTYGDTAIGVPTALAQAGLSSVKIFGTVANNDAIAELRQGKEAWWIDQPSVMDGWASFYVGLKALATHHPVLDTGQYPLAILTPQNVPGGTGVPVVPADYASEFTKLFHGESP